MNEQDKPARPTGPAESQPPLPSVRGTGDVLGGYRAPGDERHQQQPSPPHEHIDKSGPADARAEQAIDHDPDYGKWGGKEPPVTEDHKAQTAARPTAGGADQEPPTGHYGDAEMGGQGGIEPSP